jgi:hypothetical protein
MVVPLIGYVDRFSGRPGERIAIKVSSRFDAPYRAGMVTGERPKALIRAEIIYFETVAGGAVFSTGSITFCGSLSHNNYDDKISRLLENVLRRFVQ